MVLCGFSPLLSFLLHRLSLLLILVLQLIFFSIAVPGIVVLLIITSLLTVVNEIYESYPISKNRPITFFIQLIKVF